MKKIHRFFTNYTTENEGVKITSTEVVSQIFKVLKLKEGEQISVVDNGVEKIVELANVSSKNVSGFVLSEKKLNDELFRKVKLYCSVLKKENFELVVQKATEVGVSEIFPLICDRTIKLAINKIRLPKIIRESAEQCGRISCPDLKEAITFEEAIKNNGACNILFDVTGTPLKEFKFGEEVNIFVGPEGGWTDRELEMAKENNFNILNLGKNILRAETAAIISSFVSVNF